MIINFRKTEPTHPYFLHLLVNIPQVGGDLAVYPTNFTGVYGSVSNIDPDRVYDYHTAFDIKPTEVSFNVDINTNGKAIRNIQLEQNSDNSAATVAMVKEIFPFLENHIYRQYFTDFYDFSDATKYNISTSSSGVSFNGLNPNILFHSKNIDRIKVDGLHVDNYGITMTVPHSTNYTICLVMSFWRNRNMNLFSHVINTNLKTELKYDKSTNRMTLTTNRGSTNITIPSVFHGKKIVIWSTGNSNANITKLAISNYSSTLTQASSPVVNRRKNFGFSTEDGIIHRLMNLKNFYYFDSEQYHRILIQEKLSGSYVV